MHAAPAKRHHSLISPASNHTITAANSINNSNTNHSHHHHHHPFDNFMHMFGAFHRPAASRRSRQQQQEQQQQSRTAAQQPATSSSRHQQSKQARPSNSSTNSNSRGHPTSTMNTSYVPPTTRGRTTAVSTTAKPSNKPHLLVTVSSTVSSSSSSSERSGKPSSSSTSSRSKPNPNAAAAWRTAMCPRSHKPYYWNVHTRESRWKKPLELASEEEKEAIQSKERKQREFFESMERNILRKLEAGKVAAAENKRASEEAALTLTNAQCVQNAFQSSVTNPTLSPGNTNANTNSNGQMAIDQTWLQGTNLSSPNSKASEDWISGWITPGTDAGRHSPTGSLSSMEFSVTTPGSAGSLAGSMGSSMGCREERDDKVLPLTKPGRIERIKSSSKKPVIDKPDLIRTISKMEYDLVHQLNPGMLKQKSNLKIETPGLVSRLASPGAKGTMDMNGEREPLTPTTQTCDIFSSLRLTLGSEGLDVFFDAATGSRGAAPVTPTSPMTPDESQSVGDDLPSRALSSPTSISTEINAPREGMVKPNLTKRNTCGTIYLGSTLSAPDKDALIKCVCGVYRAHLLQNEAATNIVVPTFDNDFEKDEKTKRYETFNDRRAHGDYRALDTSSTPSLAQITDFYRSIFLRSQMEVDCIIITLIYVERLIKRTGGALTPKPSNWRSVLFSCMVLASKVWDDLSMWNCDFSKIGPSGMTFSLSRTNELEVALLRALEYKVKVNASEYAKYYFLLRGMLCRSGLASDDLTRSSRPLDKKAAQTLDRAGGTGTGGTARAGETDASGIVKKLSMKERSKSCGCAGKGATEVRAGSFQDDGAGGGTSAAPLQGSPSLKRVSLEHIVRM